MTTTTPAPAASTPLPWTVTAAAAVLVAYGLWVVINATLRQMATDWIDSGDYPRALIRLGGMVLIAYGLLRRQRWGWWLGVIVPSFFLLLFAVAAVALAGAGGEAAAPVDLGQLVVPALCLAGGVALLLTTSSRAFFRRST